MRTRSRIGMVALLACAVWAGGCKKETADSGGGTPSTSASGNKKTYTIGVVAKSQVNKVFQVAHQGARDAGAELGPKYGATVTVDIRTPNEESPQKQAEAIDALVRGGADAIIVSCSEAGTVTPAINRAVEKGILVMCFDSDAPQSKRQYFYGTDDVSCGQKVMQELAAVMSDTGKIAILAGSQSAPNLQNRVKGVRDELAKHPNISLISGGGGVFYHEETPEKAAEKVGDAQRNNPDIQGWAMVGGWPLFTGNALKWDPGTIKVISVDALPAQLPYLQDGHVQVLLAQDCYGWGHKSVEVVLEKLASGKDPEVTHIIDPLTRVTKENADEMAAKWKQWLKE